MQARIVAAGRGARWLAEGWRLFRVAPLGWLAAVFGYWLLMRLVSLFPLIGVAAAAGVGAAVFVGFIAPGRAAGRRGPPRVAPFVRRLPARAARADDARRHLSRLPGAAPRGEHDCR